MIKGLVQYLGGSKYHHPYTSLDTIQTVKYGDWITAPLEYCKDLWHNHFYYPDMETVKKLVNDKCPIDNMWKDERVFILGSGGSLRGFDLTKLDSEKTIVINHSLLLYPQASALIFFDLEFVKFRRKEIASFKSLIFSSMRTGLNSQTSNVTFYSTSPCKVQTKFNYGLYGKRTSLVAINLALVAGVKEIYLLGYDLNPNNKEEYAYDKHPDEKKNGKYLKQSLCEERIKEFDAFESFKHKIFNCNKESGIKLFKYKSIMEVI